MRNLITSMSRCGGLRRAVRRLRVHSLANAWLRKFPVTKRLPGTGVIYRATRLESIPLGVEMFERGSLYNVELLPKDFRTFADLGSNVGYFTCWLAHAAGGRNLKGLMIDANPAVVEEARWHAAANRWADVHALHGIVGEQCPDGHAEFFTYESNICSASQLPVNLTELDGKWKKLRVPCLSLGTLWNAHFRGERCNVLKVDIEGSELNFVQLEEEFLALVDTMFVEWHNWRVKFRDLETELNRQQFRCAKVLEENSEMGTAFFVRQPTESSR